MWLGFWTLFAQNILPDEAKIEVKSPIIQWEATNMTITMLKNWSKMSSYRGTVYITLTDENWAPLNKNDYTVPQQWLYDFSDADLWSATFEKWLEIKKVWTFYVEVEDFNDPDERSLWRQEIKVIRNDGPVWNYKIEILSPVPNITLTSQKVEIFAQVPELKNSNAIIYLDDEILDTTLTDSQWMINYVIKEVTVWRHSLKIEVLDMDWITALWSSEKIYFTTSPNLSAKVIVTVEPATWLMVWETAKITAYTDEMIESVKIKLSDRKSNEAEVLPKVGNWEFSKDVFLFNTWIIDISLETSASNGEIIEKHDNIKQFTVLDTPTITNIVTWTDAEAQIATISRDVSNENWSSYLINYRLWDENVTPLEERTDKKSFKFTDVPYDTTLNVTITPYRKEATKHGAASETIKFVITKPQLATQNPDDASLSWINIDHQPRCIVNNISTRTKKIWDNYYLIWDKVENVTKYIVYSSTKPDGSDKMKVYETSDTSYQYPFDKTSEEDKFAYFWIVWICDDWEELELTGATKVQVWPAENFFLLLCMTFLIYFWIKLFRQTEE